MGRILYSVDKLTPPLSVMDERITHTPRGSPIFVPNRTFKLVLFLVADHVMHMEKRPDAVIQGGDLLVMPFSALQTYEPRPGNKDKKLHLVRIVFGDQIPARKFSLSPSRLSRSSRVETDLATFVTRQFESIHILRGFLTPEIYERLSVLRDEARRRQPGYRFVAASLAFDIITRVARSLHHRHDAAEADSASKSALIVERVKEYLFENLRRPLTLEAIAWDVHLSREHLARLFHKVTGHTVFEYLLFLRIEAAKVQLCDSNTLVHQVAERTGFTSASLFNRTFKRQTGMTPLEFRRSRVGAGRFEHVLRENPDLP